MGANDLQEYTPKLGQKCDKIHPCASISLCNFPVIFSIVPMLPWGFPRCGAGTARRFQVLAAHVPCDGININAVLRKPGNERMPQVIKDEVFEVGLHASLRESPREIPRCSRWREGRLENDGKIRPEARIAKTRPQTVTTFGFSIRF
jgi:hypothetical protein